MPRLLRTIGGLAFFLAFLGGASLSASCTSGGTRTITVAVTSDTETFEAPPPPPTTAAVPSAVPASDEAVACPYPPVKNKLHARSAKTGNADARAVSRTLCDGEMSL